MGKFYIFCWLMCGFIGVSLYMKTERAYFRRDGLLTSIYIALTGIIGGPVNLLIAIWYRALMTKLYGDRFWG